MALNFVILLVPLSTLLAFPHKFVKFYNEILSFIYVFITITICLLSTIVCKSTKYCIWSLILLQLRGDWSSCGTCSLRLFLGGRALYVCWDYWHKSSLNVHNFIFSSFSSSALLAYHLGCKDCNENTPCWFFLQAEAPCVEVCVTM